MNVFVHSKSVPVTEAIRGFVERQSRKISKLSQPITEVRVFLDSVRTSQGLNQESKVKVKIAVRGKDILVAAKAKDLYLAITEAMEDGVRALRKKKERRLARRSHSRTNERIKIAME